ncbi:Hpt domain-containing protein [Butyrivibrio sp. MC2021]|uniref:Hpt domain-containing protein n=1 Tax=Butyrivibrio sp. MC2021 TaxID=1408306 RepID=UPI00047DDEF2|nr:Hpt domain-containing protein [Butyrivibrio sp. MC2021]
MDINIPGIDIEKAIVNSGSEELFIELLGDVYKLMDEKSDLVETYLREKDLQRYTVQVHALKTTCRMIGAMDLGEEFFTLEKLGKENNLEQAVKLTPDVLDAFRSLKPFLEPYASTGKGPQKEFDKEAFSALLNKLLEAIDDFNLGAAEDITKQLLSYSCDEDLADKLSTLDKYVSNLDYDQAKELIRQLI